MEDREGYRRGYEPSAPPAPPDFHLPLTPYYNPPPPLPPPPPSHHPTLPHYFSIHDSDDAYPSVPSAAAGTGYEDPHSRLNSRCTEGNETLGTWLVDRLANVCMGLWKTSYSVVSLDLTRTLLHNVEPETRHSRRRVPSCKSDDVRWLSDREADQQQFRPPRRWMEQIQIGRARLKFLQVWDFGDRETGEPKLPWALNLGIGLNFQIDGGKLEPKLRIRGKHASLHILPQPLLELRGKWPLADTGLAVDARYRIPLDKLAVSHGFSGAQLMVNLFNPLGTGFHLTPGGLEFDEQVVRIGKYSRLRVAAAVEFPRKFPVEEGDRTIP